jgi:hypothetical protein
MGVLNAGDWQVNWIMGVQRKSLGYHAQTSTSQNVTQWVQVDLGRAYSINTIKLHPKWHQGLPGYGFPLRFHIEISNDPTFASSNLVANQATDLTNPGYFPQPFSVANISARYVRVTATKLYKLTWNPVAGAITYNVKRAVVSGGSWIFTAQSGNNGSGITANNSLFGSGNPPAPQGIQAAFLQCVSTISQAISGFVPGVKYSVTFSAAQRATFENGGQTWSLKLDNSVLGNYSPPASQTNYADYTTNFTATAATHTLSFVGTDLLGGDNTVFLDNVRVAPAPSLVPPQIGWQMMNGQMQFSWPLDHYGWHLEMQTDAPGVGLGRAWVVVAGSQTTNLFSVPLGAGNSSALFRLVFP